MISECARKLHYLDNLWEKSCWYSNYLIGLEILTVHFNSISSRSMPLGVKIETNMKKYNANGPLDYISNDLNCNLFQAWHQAKKERNMGKYDRIMFVSILDRSYSRYQWPKMAVSCIEQSFYYSCMSQTVWRQLSYTETSRRHSSALDLYFSFASIPILLFLVLLLLTCTKNYE